jgi:predicted small lipoprotein YifL
MRAILIGVAGALLVTACGQKGPLYFRDSPPPGTKPPKVEAFKPVPYPKDPERSESPEAK